MKTSCSLLWSLSRPYCVSQIMDFYLMQLKNNRMSGKIKGTVNVYFTLFQKATTLNYTGKFKGKKQE